MTPMQVRDYVIRRLIKLPLVLIAVTIAGVHALADRRLPIAIYLAARHEPGGDRASSRSATASNDPLPVQYLHWLGGVLRGDLGWSGVSVAPVSEVLPARFIATMELATARRGHRDRARASGSARSRARGTTSSPTTSPA